jgi:hypothetical protein
MRIWLKMGVLGLSMLFSWPAVSAELTPQMKTAVAFYTWVLANPSASTPTAEERAQLAAFLTPQLNDLLKQTSAMEARCEAAAAKDEKPFTLEGDLFVGNYEGATEVAYGKTHVSGHSTIIEANLMTIDPRFAKGHPYHAFAWRDKLELVKTGTEWRVKDVHYAQGRSLVIVLKDYLSKAGKFCVKHSEYSE